jgi:putative solute:sodium symporter small subunit
LATVGPVKPFAAPGISAAQFRLRILRLRWALLGLWAVVVVGLPWGAGWVYGALAEPALVFAFMLQMAFITFVGIAAVYARVMDHWDREWLLQQQTASS